MARHLLFSFVMALPLAGCNSEPTESDVEDWVRSRESAKLNELIADSAAKMGLRARAIELLALGGEVSAVESAFKGAKDHEELGSAAAEKLVATLKLDDAALKDQVRAKDALLAVVSHLDTKRQDEVLEAISSWAFAGLNEKSDKDWLIKRLQETEMSLHLTMLRQHGINVASYLVAYGIETRRLIPFLREAKNRSPQRVVVAAVRRLFAIKNLVVPWEALDAVLTFKVPDTVDLLLDVYLNDRFGGDRQGSAIGMAQRLVYGRVEGVNLTSTPEDRAIVLKALQRLLASTRATDRWDAADMIIRVGGVEALGTVVDGFKDNIAFYSRYTPDGEIELPDYAINEFCTVKLKPKAEMARTVLESRLITGDRTQKTFAVLCLKVLANPASVMKLQPLTSDDKSLEDFFFVKEDRDKRRAQIDAKEIPELTLGLLALNAMDGIALIGELEKAKQEGKLTAEDFDMRLESVMSVISAAGESFRPAVKQVYEKRTKKPWDPEPAAPAPVAPKKP